MAHGVSVSAPTFEQHHSGLGVSTATPRISWRFGSHGSDIQGWKQSAYEVEIARDQPGAGRTFRVESSQSVLVPWPCQPLQSRERAQVRVRVSGNSGSASQPTTTEWSPWSWVECAFLSKGDWSATRITSSAPAPSDGPIQPQLFRKRVTLPSDRGHITHSRLYITAFGLYHAYINGTVVGDQCLAPGWTSYAHRHRYQIFDTTELLRQGQTNVIGVEVSDGWYAGRLGFMGGKRFNWGKDIGILAQLEVDFDGGERFTLTSDDSWICSTGPLVRSEILDGEVYDTNREISGWASSADLDESTWSPVKGLEFPSADLVSPDVPPVRVTQEVSPISIFKSVSGKTLLDFGQNLVGVLQIKGARGPQGHRITFSHAEVLEDGELCLRCLRDCTPADTLILNGGEPIDWTPKFTFHGFRYVQVDGWDDITLENLTARVMHSDMVRSGWFKCSNPSVNQLHENTVWSMRGNFVSIPTDCPQRDERLGWTGDIQVFSPTACFLFNSASFLKNWMEDVASEQFQTGQPPLVVPNILEHIFPATPQAVWADVTVLTPWAVFQSSGDIDALKKQYPSMVHWLDKGIQRGSDDLWDSTLWQLGDWLDPKAPEEAPGDTRTDGTLVADAYLVQVTEVVATVSSIIGEKANASRFTEAASRLKTAFQYKYIAPSGMISSDTQTANALAIMFNLFADQKQLDNASARLAVLVQREKFRVATGFAGTPIITHALSRTQKLQHAYRMLLEKKCPSWLYPITMGATTIWERWNSMRPDKSVNATSMTSFNHYALGSISNWLHEVVGGISPIERGWKKFRVQPQPGGNLTSAETAYESPYGRIECAWSRETVEGVDKVTVRVVVPPNSEALVVLPDSSSHDNVGSGVHSFTSKSAMQAWPPPYSKSWIGDLEKNDGEIAE